ncbi:MAG: zinc-dependent peptidase [Phaeodactylibacter sp.]|nr:zinc-dependent peptidase [Phaeodactylibacter sp.]MCB9290880.1 zinc-dependent peptidase [Lewinellaceae bacterium]
MPARILSIPFAVLALVFLYLTWEVDTGYSIYIVPCVIAMALIYVLSPQINWWWFQRRPPELKPKIRMLITRHLPYYQKLVESEQGRFRKRVALYMEANDFRPQGMETVPEDLRAIAAACAVQITFGQKDFLLPKFENIIFYPHPFPSPQYPENFHSSEVYEEDGVVIFSAEQLLPGFLQPFQYYNIGLHEYAKVFVRSNPQIDFPKVGADTWPALEQISGFRQAAIQKWINLDPIPVQPVSIAHFFTFPQRFQAVLPELYGQYERIFNQSPAREATPVLEDFHSGGGDGGIG